MPETPSQPSTLDRLREDVERAGHAADMAIHGFVIRSTRELEHCTAADRDGLLVRFVITWLLANGLVVAADDSAFEQWLPMDLPDELAGDVSAKVAEAVAHKAHLDGIASAVRLGVNPDRPADWVE